jgi:hypothetical protein
MRLRPHAPGAGSGGDSLLAAANNELRGGGAVPSVWECARCDTCDVAPEATPPLRERFDALPRCGRCAGCTHTLTMLNLTARGARCAAPHLRCAAPRRAALRCAAHTPL